MQLQDKIVFSFQSDYNSCGVFIENCTIRQITASADGGWCPPSGSIGDNMIIGTYNAFWNQIDDQYFVTGIGANSVIERFDVLTYEGEAPQEYTYTTKIFRVGANSIVKVTSYAQRFVASGALVFDADPTAQIINLED